MTATLQDVAARYAVSVSDAMRDAIALDATGGMARQFLPDAAELDTLPIERADPIGDIAHMPVRGIVHRHADRALFKIVAACPVYCRFCFRRDMIGPGSEHALTPADESAAYAYLAAHPEIHEVILTGGDPFILSPRRAAIVTRELAAIEHVKIIRWHTRVPLVDPARVTPDFVAAMRAPGTTTIVAIHANHPGEFTPAGIGALARLVDAGIPLLSQTVLLAGVNDDAATLASLMRLFVEHRVKPYYLHHPDLAPGTSHFRLTLARGRELMRDLRARVSGLCMPNYVLDLPGGHAKISIESHDIEETPRGYRVRGENGWRHYP